MKYATLGNSGIEVSRICIGGMGFGEAQPGFHQWVIDQPSTQEVVKRALELGINFFDNANTYSAGTSEQFVGQSLRNLGVRREDVVLSSKVYFNEGGLSAAAINREIDKTLANYGTDYLDLYLIHRFDYDYPIEETMEALDGLVKAGKVRTLGACEMYAYQLHNMQLCAEANGWTTFSVLQPHYNLIYREDERELLPVAAQYNMAVTPYSALAGGHLTRPTWEGTSKRAQTDKVAADKYDGYRDNNMQIIDRLAEVAQRHDVAMADVAIAWQLARGITSPICGANKPNRVDSLVHAVDLELTAEECAYMEEPYRAHELVGPAARPGEKALAGTMASLKK